MNTEGRERERRKGERNEATAKEKPIGAEKQCDNSKMKRAAFNPSHVAPFF